MAVLCTAVMALRKERSFSKIKLLRRTFPLFSSKIHNLCLFLAITSSPKPLYLSHGSTNGGVSMANTCANSQLRAYYASPTSANFNALFNQYSPLVRSMLSRVRFIPGYDWDDLQQEARIVCWRAVTSFSLTNDVSFGAYFRVCLSHCIAGLIREAHTHKRGVAFASTSLEHFVDTRGIHPSDISAHASSAEDIVILREWLRLYAEQLNVREAFILWNFLTEPHCSASILARQMQCSRSSVYSLLYRCKAKLRQSSSQ